MRRDDDPRPEGYPPTPEEAGGTDLRGATEGIIQPQGMGHEDADPARQPEQEGDLTGEAGPSYEQNQGDPAVEHSGGGIDPNDTLSTSVSGLVDDD